ncbi:PREDICTED: uncharacterized protein LOC105461248, partial [Wasmannia auropunctata]|uniref:uncharacterized protein LOC105461248 n=1 Tax=Wasmannia auropunctata TaxID=64793 RepID=UPI0005EEE859
ILFVLMHSDDLDRILELMPVISGSVTCGVKFASLNYHFKKFKIMLQQVHDDWMNLSMEAERIFRKYMEYTWRFTSVYLGFIIAFVIGYSLLPLVNRALDIVSPLNITRPKKLMHPAEMLVDQEKYYYTLLIIMYYGYIISIAILAAIDTIYFVFIEHACALFEIL